MPRFAVLTHDHPFPHWDFLLESGAACRTWRLLAEPGPGRTVPAEPLPDHRPHYLAYEGPVSGGRGTVTRWDAGTFGGFDERPDRIVVTLDGSRLRNATVVARDETGWSVSFAPS